METTPARQHKYEVLIKNAQDIIKNTGHNLFVRGAEWQHSDENLNREANTYLLGQDDPNDLDELLDTYQFCAERATTGVSGFFTVPKTDGLQNFEIARLRDDLRKRDVAGFDRDMVRYVYETMRLTVHMPLFFGFDKLDAAGKQAFLKKLDNLAEDNRLAAKGAASVMDANFNAAAHIGNQGDRRGYLETCLTAEYHDEVRAGHTNCEYCLQELQGYLKERQKRDEFLAQREQAMLDDGRTL